MASEPHPLLLALEAQSRLHPDRVLRLRGDLPAAEAGVWEPFEVLLFRGFSSSTSHPTAFDPDQPLLTAQAQLHTAELLQGPLRPDAEQRLAGPERPEAFLADEAWQPGL